MPRDSKAVNKLQKATAKEVKPDVEVPIKNPGNPAKDLGVDKPSQAPPAYQGHSH